jgi:hypothetical protein
MKKFLLILSLVLVGLFYFKFFFRKEISFSTNARDVSALEVQQRVGQIYITTTEGKNITGSVIYKGNKPSISTIQKLIIDSAQSKIEKTEVRLPKDANVTLTLAVGAGNLELLLRDSKLTQATISAGASNMHLVLPDKVSSEYTISVGAGNIQIDVPKGVQGLRFVLPQGSSFNVDNQNYTLVNRGYQSKGFDGAQTKSTIHLSAGSANLTIREVD